MLNPCLEQYEFDVNGAAMSLGWITHDDYPHWWTPLPARCTYVYRFPAKSRQAPSQPAHECPPRLKARVDRLPAKSGQASSQPAHGCPPPPPAKCRQASSQPAQGELGLGMDSPLPSHATVWGYGGRGEKTRGRGTTCTASSTSSSAGT